ncbi:MAG: penicillin-binding protein 2 [Anaerolineae bacterium]|nr:penicillin-binding protein 2 [Anaerolineae bacterium]
MTGARDPVRPDRAIARRGGAAIAHHACRIASLLALLLAACNPTPAPTIAVLPTATATTTPVTTPAHETAAAYLAAWAERDYEAMYALCSTESRTSTPLDEFVRVHEQAASTSTLIALQPTLYAVLQEGARARAAYSAEWETSFVGAFRVDNELPMVWDGAEWRVDWSRACILPGLEGDNVLNMQSSGAIRANIYDVQGKGLAVKGELVTVGVVPGQIEDEPALLSRLSVVLDLPQSEIKAVYEGQPATWFIPIADISVEASHEHYDFLSKAAGVVLRPKAVRAYTEPIVAPHVIGFMGKIPAEELEDWRALGYTGDELVGRTGIEAWGEPYLAGQRGGVLTILTREGQLVRTLARRDAVPARSVYLTFEHGFQKQVEELLGERKGAVVVMDVRDGRVLALATWPRFDITLFADGIDPVAWSALVNDPSRPQLNRAIQGQYPAGSTFKIVTMGTLMERGGVGPTQTYSCPGSWDKLGWPMTCWLKSGHGTVQLVDALTFSCDVAFYQVGYDLSFIDRDALPSYARSFGFGAPTGIGRVPDGDWDALGEASGLVPDDAWKRQVYGDGWSTGDNVNLAIGQGFLLVTPLQMARMVAAVANGGTLYRPQIVSRVAAAGEEPEIPFQPDVVGRLPITADTLQAIRTGMVGVTTKRGGTATHRFVDFPYTVAGKTGTAQNEGELPHSWFVGYLPAEEPEIAIVAMIENVGEGTTYAAPLFRLVAAAYYGVEQEVPEVEGQGD